MAIAATGGSWASAGGPVAVADSVANVSAHLDSLQSLTDAGIPALSVTPTQLIADSQAPEFLADVTVTAQSPTSAQHWLVLT